MPHHRQLSSKFNCYQQNQIRHEKNPQIYTHVLISQQNFQQIKQAALNKSREDKNKLSRITVCPILQPQQPQNYLNELQIGKQVSLISCKSQPLSLSKCEITSSKHIFPKIINSSVERFYRNDKLNYENDNKKTRKYLTSQNINNQEQTLVQDEYYKLGNTESSKNIRIKQKDRYNFNQQTLRVNKTCRHKSQRQSKQGILLQNVNSRIQICQTYIQMNQRKTNLLQHELNYLLAKEYQRHQRKIRKMENHKHKKRFKSSQQQFEAIYLSPQKISKCKHKFLQQKERQIYKRKNNKNDNSSQALSTSKFHYRSSENKSSRMKQLIYFQQSKKNSKNQNCHKKQQETQKEIHNNFNDDNQKNKESTSIYCNRQSMRQIKNKDKVNKSQIFPHAEYHMITNIQKANNEKSNIQNICPIKSQIRKYEVHQEQLLLKQQRNKQRQSQILNKSKGFYQNKQSTPINFQFINSKIVSKSPVKQQDQDDISINQISPKKTTAYLTREFQVSQNIGHGHYNSGSQQKKDFSQISYQNSLQSDFNQRFGHIKNTKHVPKHEQRAQIDCNNRKSQKQKIKQKNQINFQKSKSLKDNDMCKKQFTFIDQILLNREQLLEDYQVVDSNYNSPSHLENHNSSSNSSQSQLIEEFNDLVITAAREATPLKKRLINEQIYRTSQLLRQNNQNVFKSNQK